MQDKEGNTMRTTSSESKEKETHSYNKWLKEYRTASERQATGFWMDGITDIMAQCNNVMLPKKRSYKACLQISPPAYIPQEQRMLTNGFTCVLFEGVLEADRAVELNDFF